MTNTTRWMAVLFVLVLSSHPMATPPAAVASAAPAAVETSLRELYSDWGGEVRYFASSIDLNGDSRDEIVVHLAGQTLCGSEGCDTLVFTPSGTSFRRVATIRLTHAPIRVSQRSTNGWRNLVVSVSRGGERRYATELRYDGESYPADPTTIPIRRWAHTVADVVIPPYESIDSGTPLVLP